MVGTGETFALDKVGAWAIESLVYFFIGSLAVAFLGAGRYAWGKTPRISNRGLL
jgi:putative oxidoreductase